ALVPRPIGPRRQDGDPHLREARRAPRRRLPPPALRGPPRTVEARRPAAHGGEGREAERPARLHDDPARRGAPRRRPGRVRDHPPVHGVRQVAGDPARRRQLQGHRPLLHLLLMLTLLAAVLLALQEKNDPAFAPVTDDPKLPRVLLIGDSISIGYTIP